MGENVALVGDTGEIGEGYSGDRLKAGYSGEVGQFIVLGGDRGKVGSDSTSFTVAVIAVYMQYK